MAKLFFSYSHKDEDLRNELETHLALLRRQRLITSWHDRRITAGMDFSREISSELESSQIILLLISAHFLASDYCSEKEMDRALEKQKDGSAVVIPVILHPCDWQSAPFGHLRATPTDGKAVSMYANPQEAFAIIAKDVREALESTITSVPLSTTARVQVDTRLDEQCTDRSSNLRVKRTFDDHERDKFVEDSYEYMARYFDTSLQELSKRNPHIKTRLKRVGETRFAAYVYANGDLVAQCSVWYTGNRSRSAEIAYSSSGDTQTNSYNEALHIADDGYTLYLKPLGMHMAGNSHEETLSKQGAAEYYWSILIRPLQ